MIPFQSIGSPEEGPTHLEHTVGTPPVHVRRKWIVVSTIAWVIGGGLGFAMSIFWSMFAYLGGVSGFVSDLANALLEALDFMLAGSAVALGQWLIFRSVLRHAKRWLFTSALAWILAGMLASLAYELFLYATHLTSGNPAELRTYAQLGSLAAIAAGAIMIGALQWLALRRVFQRAGVWIPVSAFAWVIGIGVTLLSQRDGQCK